MNRVRLLLGLAAGISAVTPPSCNKADLVFSRFPLDGVNGRDYFINNYYDSQRAQSFQRDFMGRTGALARTYDQHNGADIDIANFERMDSGAARIRAAAPGVVTAVVQNQPDRNSIWCGGLAAGVPRPQWNVVVIRHANGWRSIYGHMKRNSATVAVNQVVSAGTVLGVVGSSGCSTDPHLHFEVQDCSNTPVDPFQATDMWNPNPPAYTPTSNVMSLNLKVNAFNGQAQLRDPPNSITLITPNKVLGVGVTLSVRQGDVLNIRVFNRQGLFRTFSRTMDGNARKSRRRFGYTVTLNGEVGQWRVEARMNNVLRQTRYFKVSSFSPYMQEVVVAGVPIAGYQKKFVDAITAGYRPELVDGYSVGGKTFMNAVFRRNFVGYAANHGLTSAQYQNKFDNRRSGWGPTSVESYLENGNVRYALIMKPVSYGWSAVHGQTQSQWNTLFTQKKNAGLYPTAISVVVVGGQRYYTALWTTQSIGSYTVYTRVRVSDYQNLFNTQTSLGRRPMYLNSHVFNNVQYFTVIFASIVPTSYEARHGLTISGLMSKKASNNPTRLTQALTGYPSGSLHRFAAVWHRD